MFRGTFTPARRNAGFGAAVFEPGPMPVIDPEAIPALESETTELKHGAEQGNDGAELTLGWTGVVAKERVETEALENYKRELVQEVFAVQQKVEQFIQSNRATRRGRLERELEHIREEGRQQQQACDTAQAEFYRADQARVECENGKRRASNALREHRDRAPDRFASQGDRVKHQRRDQTLVEACQEVDASFAAALRARNQTAGIWEEEKIKLERLDQDAERLERELAGEPYFDPSTGLTAVPQA